MFPKRSGAPRRLARISRRTLLLSLAAVLACTGVAMAVGGLANPSFESGLSGWTAKTVRTDAYGVRTTVYDSAEPAPQCEGPSSDLSRVCLIDGSDDFTVPLGPAPDVDISVAPRHGTKMVRLGGPYVTEDSGQQDPELRQEVAQTFLVEPASPILRLAYNIFTWDEPGYDDLEFRVTLTNEAGAPIAQLHRESFSGGGLSSSGWQPATFNLGPYAGQQVHLRIRAGGTEDTVSPFWAYVDQNLVSQTAAPKPPVIQPPVVVVPPAKPCAGLKGRKLAKCKVNQLVKKKCGSKKGKKKKVCAKRVRATAKCKAMKAGTKKQRAKKQACLKRAKNIGKKPKKNKK